jgi:tight adherence protein C
LRNFSRRTREPEIQKFASLLIDTDRFGSSLAPALRVHARYLRTRFRQSAQERARKVGVKLIFPVFFLIFPSVILVTLGPAVLLLYTQMKNLLGQ